MAVVVAVAAAVSGVGLGNEARAETRWASAGTAPIHPGVQVVSPAGQCTANFVFVDGGEVYLGLAAHCVALGDATDINGCTTQSLPLGTPVSIEGGTRHGTLAYSSWLAMQQAGEQRGFVCGFNDFSLIRVHPNDHGRVNPSVPHWGGPVGIDRDGMRVLETVHSLGNSRLRGGSPILQPKTGFVRDELAGGWSHSVLLVLPGIPGDSGSAMLDQQGRAVGIASTLGLLPAPLSNNFSDVGHALDYARAHGHPGLRLAVGTEPYNGNRAPIGSR